MEALEQQTPSALRRSLRRSVAGESPEQLVVMTLIAVIVLLQRLAVPLGGGRQVPLVLPVAVLVVVVGSWRGVLRTDALRMKLYLLALGACVISTVVTAARGKNWSQLAVAYLVLTYFPFVYVLRRWDRSDYERSLVFFVRLMTCMAVIGSVGVAAQLLGWWTYSDLLGFLPRSLLLKHYNTASPVRYGSQIYRSNGILFLEPSFFSLFLALAIVVQVQLRRSGLQTAVVQTAVLLVALLASVSGTGAILLGVGIVALWVDRHEIPRLLFALGGLALAVLLLTPIGPVFHNRGEVKAGSSANLRFVEPYQRLVVDHLRATQPASMAFGEGAGEALEGVRGLQAPVAAKVLYEYGACALLVFGAFMAGVAFVRVPCLALGATLFIMWAALSSSFLQPCTVLAVYVLSSVQAVPGLRAEIHRAGAR